jgi:hypothetical protein
MAITSSHVREINLEFWTTSLVTFKTLAYMYFAISQLTPLNQFFWGEIKTSKTHTQVRNIHNQSLPYLYSTS